MLNAHAMGGLYFLVNFRIPYRCDIRYPSGDVCSDNFIPDTDVLNPDNWRYDND
jgi:hypothetical protein